MPGRVFSATDDEYDGLRERERSGRTGDVVPEMEWTDDVPEEGDVVKPLGKGGFSLSVDPPRDDPGRVDGGDAAPCGSRMDEKLGTEDMVALSERTLTDRGRPGTSLLTRTT